MVFRIALRNLLQHRAKTLIIGGLVTLGIVLTFVGNCLISTMGAGITKSFTDNFTGEVLVTSNEGMGSGVFGAQSDELFGPPVIPILKDYDKALERVKALPGLRSWTSQLSAYAGYNFEEKGSDWGLFFGIEPDDYFKSMDNVRILDGRKLADGEEGLMLNVRTRDNLEKNLGVKLKVGDIVQLNGFGDAGFKIREVPLLAVFEFKGANQRMFTPSIVDIRTLRVLSGKNVGPVEKVKVSKEATALMDANIDDLFSGTLAPAPAPSGSKVLDEGALKAMLGGKTPNASIDMAGKGAWNFILLRLDPGADPKPLIRELNKGFEAEGIRARAQGWQPSGAPDSYTFAALGLIFNVAMVLLAVVSIIIIMNTLVISVMERTSEIGTMRALGAQKGFVRRMFIAETLSVTAIFGALGIALGAAAVAALGAAGIKADGDFLAVIYGGKVLRPVVSGGPVLVSVALILVMGLVSWIYPVALALKVTPLKAITAE
jgi:putative ABC transport system permease protein